METVFLKLFNFSMEAAWLILAVLVLRLLLRRAPKNARCVMWGIVGLRLIFPFPIESVLSLIPSREVLSERTVRYDPSPTIHTGVQAIDDAVNPAFSRTFAASPAASVNPLHVLTYIAGWVWAMGVAVMLLYFIISAVSLKRRVSGAVETERGIRESELVPSPFVFGLIRPTVYLPSGMAPESRRYVVAHELAHIRRRDYLFKPLAFLVLTVYWFDPLVWLSYVLLCRDIELACDEAVLKELGSGCKKAYSEALLSAVTFHRHVAACPVAFGEGKLTQRIKNVLRWKKPVLWVTVASVLVCAVLAACFLTDPRPDGPAGGYIYAAGGQDPMFTPFTITLREDGTFSYTEGMASSYVGTGTWTEEDGVVTLTDTAGGDARTYIFRRSEEGLRYVAEGSDNFIYVQVPDGALFVPEDGYEAPELSPETVVDTDFVNGTPWGWRINITVGGKATIHDDSTGETRGDEVWSGDGFDMFAMWDSFNGNHVLLRQGGKYKALEIREGRLWDIALRDDPDALLTPHSASWEGPFWLLLDAGDDIAVYTVGDEWAYPRSDPEFYASLFEKSAQSDGATSELLADVYAEIFDLDPERFLAELGSQSQMALDNASQLLVYGKSYGDFDAFRELITGHPAVSAPAGAALLKIQDAIEAYIDTMTYDNFPMNESHSRWAQSFKDSSGVRRVTVNDSSGNERTVPAPEGYGVVSCEPLCWIGENTLLVKGAYPGGTVLFLFDARDGASAAVGEDGFYEALFGDSSDSDFYASRRAEYYPALIEADAGGFLSGLLMAGGTEELVDRSLDIAARGCAVDAETADMFDDLMRTLWDDSAVGELAQALSGRINSLMAEKAETAVPPVFEGIPQRQEPFSWSPELPGEAVGLAAMPDWVPAQPMGDGSVLPVLTGGEVPGFDALPDLAVLHEWQIDLGGDAWWDGASLEDRAYRAATALWGDGFNVSDTDGGYVFSTPVVDGFREEIRIGGADRSSLSLSFFARNEYTETAPYYRGSPVTPGESVEAARAMAAAFGMESLTAGEPSALSDAGQERQVVGWQLLVDGLPFMDWNIISYVIDGKVTDFSVTIPAVTAVTDGAPRWFLTPEQALYCVNYARSLAHQDTVEGDSSYKSELIRAPLPVSVTLCWSDFFSDGRGRLTPAYYFSFQSEEYLMEGFPWRDTACAVVDAYTGKIRMTAGWEEWDSPYTGIGEVD